MPYEIMKREPINIDELKTFVGNPNGPFVSHIKGEYLYLQNEDGFAIRDYTNYSDNGILVIAPDGTEYEFEYRLRDALLGLCGISLYPRKLIKQIFREARRIRKENMKAIKRGFQYF